MTSVFCTKGTGWFHEDRFQNKKAKEREGSLVGSAPSLCLGLVPAKTRRRMLRSRRGRTYKGERSR